MGSHTKAFANYLFLSYDVPLYLKYLLIAFNHLAKQSIWALFSGFITKVCLSKHLTNYLSASYSTTAVGSRCKCTQASSPDAPRYFRSINSTHWYLSSTTSDKCFRCRKIGLDGPLIGRARCFGSAGKNLLETHQLLD